MSKKIKYYKNETNKLLAFKEMLDHYRVYFRDLYDLLNDDFVGGGFIDQETFDEVIDSQLHSGSIDYYSMLSHIDSFEKENKDLVEFPMLKHRPFFKK